MDHADADGFVELPNVDLVTEMTDLTSANRSYQANVTVLNAVVVAVAASVVRPVFVPPRARVSVTPAVAFPVTEGMVIVPPVVGVGNPTENHRGDVEAGLASAEKQIDATYEAPPQ